MFRPTQPIFDHFRDIIVSGTEKLIKPDPAIYALALKRFGLQPGEAIFIDDNLANVVAAGENGFARPSFQHDAKSLRAELSDLGLLGKELGSKTSKEGAKAQRRQEHAHHL